MPSLSDSQHESFAQARFAGKSIEDAYAAAGFTGQKTSASKFNRLPEVRERIAELHREAAAGTIYDKTQAVGDLIAIIHACASEAEEDHPLCEVRIGKDGPYHRFPPKLQAMARLIKLMGWDEPVKVEVELKDNFIDLLKRIRSSHNNSSSYSSSSSSSSPKIAPPPPDPIGPTGPICPIPPVTAFPSTLNSQLSTDSPLTSRQQSFANARAKGLGVMEAYHAAGYSGDTPNLAWRLNNMPAIKARIAQFNGAVEAATGYRKDDAIRDLVAIMRARPSQAGPDHPLCEIRQSHWGPYHRFPSKLAAITLLAKMLGWEEPDQLQVDHDPDAKFKQLAECIRQRS